MTTPLLASFPLDLPIILPLSAMFIGFLVAHGFTTIHRERFWMLTFLSGAVYCWHLVTKTPEYNAYFHTLLALSFFWAFIYRWQRRHYQEDQRRRKFMAVILSGWTMIYFWFLSGGLYLDKVS